MNDLLETLGYIFVVDDIIEFYVPVTGTNFMDIMKEIDETCLSLSRFGVPLYKNYYISKMEAATKYGNEMKITMRQFPYGKALNYKPASFTVFENV